MLLYLCGTLALIGLVGSQSGQVVTCPSQEEITQCSSYVKELSETTTTPIHDVFYSKTFFIKPLEWNEWEIDQICKQRENYILFLKCAVDKRKRCVLEDRRDPFMTTDRIRRSINFLCDFYKCNDCTRYYCKYGCDRDKFFDFDCASSQVPQLSACMQPYDNSVYNPPSSDLNRRRWEFNEYQCKLIDHHKECTKSAYRPCGFYTANLTNYFTEYNRPLICGAPNHLVSAILVLTLSFIVSIV